MRGLFIEIRKTNKTENIERYFSEVSLNHRITPEEEIELAIKIQKGDQAALEKLVKANLRFVISVAKQYAADPDTLQELIAQGNIGLIEAARKFDPTLGFKFISYAVWFIRKEIMLYYGKLQRTVAMPVKVEQDLRRIRNAEISLEMELERPPTTEELVDRLTQTGQPIKPEKVEKLKTEERSTVALDYGEEEEVSPIDWLQVIDPNLSSFEGQGQDLVAELLSVLKPEEADIVKKVLGFEQDPMHFITINEIYNRSAGWSGMVFNRAVRKMRVHYSKIKREL